MTLQRAAQVAGVLACLALGAGAAGCDSTTHTDTGVLVPTVELMVVGGNARVGDTIRIIASLRLTDSTRIMFNVRPTIGWMTSPESRLVLVADDSLGDARFVVRAPGTATVTAYTIRNAVLDSASTSVSLDLRVAWREVAAGPTHTCAVGSSRLFCWGGMAIGTGPGAGFPATSLVPRAVPGFEGGAGSSITAGGGHACGYGRAFGAALRISCWGNNHRGQLGNGGFAYAASPVPVEIAGIPVSRLVGPEAGERHTCALLASGGSAKPVFCWGDHAALQLGGAEIGNCPAGDGRCQAKPVSVGVALRTIDAGGEHTCGISDGDDAVCWGSDAYGQLGRSDAMGTAGAPAPVLSPWLFAQVTAGATHSCAVTPAGAAYCWGDNRYGQLGTDAAAGTCAGAPCARAPVAVSGGVMFRLLSAGNGFTCGISVTNAVYCWGRAEQGQLGPNASEASCGGIACSSRPARVLDNAFSVAAGGAHACAVTFSGDLFCWGSNSKGQLGDGKTNSRRTPRVVEEPEWIP